MFSEDNQRVVVLLHTARRALYRGFEPGRDALVVEDVLALEPLGVRPARPDPLKTDGTCLGEVRTTFAVLDRLLLAFCPVEGY